MKNNTVLFMILVMVVSLGACTPEEQEPTLSLGCQYPPQDFSSSNLVGSWIAGRPDWSDTLIIRDDGTYKQILHLRSDTVIYDYESEWQSWWLEPQSNSVPHLHLSGYRVCAYWTEIGCDQVGGGEGYWTDFCQGTGTKVPGEGVIQGKGMQMPNEGILLVLGAPRTAEFPQGVNLVLLKRGIYAAWTFLPSTP